MNRPNTIFVALISLALAACGGGGGGSSPTPSTVGPTTSPTTTPTSTPPASVTMTGKAVELVSGAALAGFTVTVGTAPNTTTCTAAQTASANPCGVPSGATTTTTTATDGSFSMTIPAGPSMLTIGNGTGTYATLHRTVNSTSPALGTVNVAALSADEQAWLVDINAIRALIAVPTSYSNLTVDEYAEEQARTEANAVASGTAAFGDTTETTYVGLYAAMPNLVYSGAASVQAVQHDPLGFPVTYGSAPLTVTQPATARGYQGADDAWMYGEIQNCPGDNWKTCTFSLAGHYINLSNTLDVWAGLGESTVSNPGLGGKVYEILLPQS